MLMNGAIKVKCVRENNKGFIVGNIYDAYRIASNIKGKDEMLSVVDSFGEEYAYPKVWFEVLR